MILPVITKGNEKMKCFWGYIFLRLCLPLRMGLAMSDVFPKTRKSQTTPNVDRKIPKAAPTNGTWRFMDS